MRRTCRLAVAFVLGTPLLPLSAGCGSSASAPLSFGPTPDGGPRHDAAPAPTTKVVAGPSCQAPGPGSTSCAGGTCCAAPRVAGGAFFRSYDGISTNGATKANPATVSDFSLDQYEVTVARFRAFVAATTSGWAPAAGAGKHAYLTAGGVTDTTGALEKGWDATWTPKLATTAAAWGTALACDASFATWTPAPGATEDHPINCLDWYDAYAFCIWDGGFLPTEAEWNYAAAGGTDQRVYPWSLAYPPGSTTLDCSHAAYSATWPTTSCVPGGTSAVGAFSPAGDGKWGHADLAGNVFEWTLDSFEAAYSASCSDCADLAAVNDQVIRGGSYDGSPACLLNSLREDSLPAGRSASIGVRCARPPG